MLPSPNLIITLENWGYMAILKEKIGEIKGFPIESWEYMAGLREKVGEIKEFHKLSPDLVAA